MLARRRSRRKVIRTKTDDSVELGVDEKPLPKMRSILRKRKHLCSGNLGKISATTHLTNVVPCVRPFKSAPCDPDRRKGKSMNLRLRRNFPRGTLNHPALIVHALCCWNRKRMHCYVFAWTNASLTGKQSKTHMPYHSWTNESIRSVISSSS